MVVLVTGGFGLVGRSVVRELILAGHSVRLFDTPTAGGLGRLLHRLPTGARRRIRKAASAAARSVRSSSRRRESRPVLEIVRGNLCNVADVGEAVREVDAVIHLGAMIPPAADQYPVYADYVNRGGTENLIAALERNAPSTRFIFASSVAIYGDRLDTPDIALDDQPNPNPGDHYAHQKLAAETALRASPLDWTIFRLTAIASPEKLKLDPLMFEMPLETRIEICTPEDVATALVRALECRETSREVFHLAGGERCRTSFGEYVAHTVEIMGLGKEFFPPQAFGPGPFHCGNMETARAQELLHFQNHSLDDYYRDVERRVRWRRPLVRLLRAPIRALLLSKSPYWRAYERGLPTRTRRQARFGWSVGGSRAHQPM